jgi:hypothetical protein
LETPIGAVIAGNVNNAAPTRDNAKVKMLSLLSMTTLPDLRRRPPMILAGGEIAVFDQNQFSGTLFVR